MSLRQLPGLKGLIEASVHLGVLDLKVGFEIESDDPGLQPAYEELARSCSAVEGEAVAVHTRVGWCDGGYTWTTYRLFDRCPGEGVAHMCSLVSVSDG